MKRQRNKLMCDAPALLHIPQQNAKGASHIAPMLEQAQRQQEREQWSLASEEALCRVWDNASDAAYDNWRALYGL